MIPKLFESSALGLHVYEEGHLEIHDGWIGWKTGIVDFDDNLAVIYPMPDVEQ